MTLRGAHASGSIGWFKARKRELLAHVRALEDFRTAYALISRLVEDTDGENDVTEQLRGALYMSAVVTYARQFLPSNTNYGERRTYPTRHLKSDARFDQKIHTHLMDVRNKMIAHDDGEQLPPQLLILNITVNDADEDAKPLVATVRSYSLSSAKGTKFLKSVQDHLEGCVTVVQSTMHDGLEDYLIQSSAHPQASRGAAESPLSGIKRSFTTESGKANEVQKLFKLDELNAEIISVPQGNLHNKAYTYRMLTYSIALPSASFKVKNEDITVFLGDGPIKQSPATPRHMVARLYRGIIEWGKKPFF
jgi:hypothetical protein